MADNIIKRFINIFVNSDEAVAGLKKTENALDGVDASTQKVTQSTEKLTDSTNKHKKSVIENGGAVGLLNELTGGLASTFKDATEAVELTGGSFRTLKGAIAATGIGLLVIGLGLLIENFDKVKQVLYNLFPVLKSVGEFFTSIKDTVTDFLGVTSDATRALDRNKEIAKKQLAINKQYLEEHESQLNEETKAKIEAKNRYLEVIAEQGKASAERTRELNRQLKKIDKDHSDEVAKETEEANKKAAEKKEKEDKERIAKEKKYWEDYGKARQDAFNAEQEEYKFQTEAIAKLRQERLDEEARITQEGIDNFLHFIEQENELRQSSIESEEAVTEAKKNALNTALNILSEFAGKNKALALGILAVQKGLAIAEIITNASKGIAVSQSNLATVPPVIGVAPNPLYPLALAAHLKNVLAIKIGAATNIATILAQTISSASNTLNAGTGESASGGGGGAGAPTQAAEFNIVGQTPANQLASTLSGRQQVIKAQVVSSEVSSAQALDRNKIEQSVFL